jgi:hypothetical protein
MVTPVGLKIGRQHLPFLVYPASRKSDTKKPNLNNQSDWNGIFSAVFWKPAGKTPFRTCHNIRVLRTLNQRFSSKSRDLGARAPYHKLRAWIAQSIGITALTLSDRSELPDCADRRSRSTMDARRR